MVQAAANFIEPAEPVAVMGGMFEAYHREGFELGYRHASSELLARLVLAAEEVLHEQPASAQPQLRKTLYAFVDRIERELTRTSAANDFVEGGLGI